MGGGGTEGGDSGESSVPLLDAAIVGELWCYRSVLLDFSWRGVGRTKRKRGMRRKRKRRRVEGRRRRRGGGEEEGEEEEEEEEEEKEGKEEEDEKVSPRLSFRPRS